MRRSDRNAFAHTENILWRNRVEFPVGRDAVREFLRANWHREPVSASRSHASS